MNLSVILPTWNQASRLGKTLEAIRACHVPSGLRWELVLVNNNSTDDTAQVARRFSSLLPLVYVEEPRQGLSQAKNTGLRVARGDLIVHADDDIRPHPAWLSSYWSAYAERPRGFYFGGSLACVYEHGAPSAELLRLAPPSIRGLDFGPVARSLSPGERFLGANWACPAEILRSLGGYDTRLGLNPSTGRMRVGEEYYLMDGLRTHGFSGWYIPEAKVVHVLPREKCDLNYIAKKIHAQGVFVTSLGARIDPRCYPYYDDELDDLLTKEADPASTRLLFRLLRRVSASWLRWLRATACGGPAHAEHLTLKFNQGMVRGLLQRRAELPARPTRLPCQANSVREDDV